MLSAWAEASDWHDQKRSKANRQLIEEIPPDAKELYLEEHATPRELGNYLLKQVAKGRLKKPYKEITSYWRSHRTHREELVKLLDKLFFRLTFTNFVGTQAWYLIEFSKYFVVTLTQTEVATYFRPLYKNVITYEKRWKSINPKLRSRLTELRRLLAKDSAGKGLWKERKFNYFRKSVDFLEWPEEVFLILAEYTLEGVQVMFE